jgi:hypothetical protein
MFADHVDILDFMLIRRAAFRLGKADDFSPQPSSRAESGLSPPHSVVSSGPASTGDVSDHRR